MISAGRRHRRRTHLVPLVVLAAAAFAGGVVVGQGHGASERAVAGAYIRDWARGNYAAMYALLDAASRAAMDERAFARTYRRAAATVTLTAVLPGRVGRLRAGRVGVSVRIPTRLFGVQAGIVEVPVSSGSNGILVHYVSTLLFPGLRPGESLVRHDVMPPQDASHRRAP